MCALLAAGFESNVSADNWTAFRAQMRERLRHQQGPAVEAMREFYRQHELRDTGAYAFTLLWFGWLSGPAPGFQAVLRRDELPPEVIALEGFSEILSNYYQEQKIGQCGGKRSLFMSAKLSGCMILFRRWCSSRQHICVKSSSNPGSGHLQSSSSRWWGASPNVRNFGTHYALVLSGGEEIPTDCSSSRVPAFPSGPVAPDVSSRYGSQAVAVREGRCRPAPCAGAKRRLRVVLCGVHGARRGTETQAHITREREAALNRDDEEGYVLVKPLFRGAAQIRKLRHPR